MFKPEQNKRFSRKCVNQSKRLDVNCSLAFERIFQWLAGIRPFNYLGNLLLYLLLHQGISYVLCVIIEFLRANHLFDHHFTTLQALLRNPLCFVFDIFHSRYLPMLLLLFSWFSYLLLLWDFLSS